MNLIFDKQIFQYPQGKTFPSNALDVGKAQDLDQINPEQVFIVFSFSKDWVDVEAMLDHIDKTLGFKIVNYGFLGETSPVEVSLGG